MNRTLGATCVSCLLAVAGFVGLGAGGYMTMTGQTVCSMVGGCGDKAAKSTETKVVTVSNKESGEKKSCCALKATAAKNKEGCTSEANVVAASAKEGCSAEKKAACGAEGAAVAVAAKEASGCCKSKAEGAAVAVAAKEGCSAEKKAACGAEGAAVAVAAKEEGCSAAKAACSASKSACSGKKGSFVMMNASYPIAMPAMFFNAEAKVTPISFKEADGCSDAAKVACASAPSACCKAKKEGAAVAVAATEKASGCCKAKAEGAAVAVAAKEASDAGCCKGTGVRADGQACKNDGEHCKKACDDKKAETKAGEPVASR